RLNGRLFYADLQLGTLNVFTLPQFGSEILPSGQTVHGFGQDANGELYAMATSTPPNGNGGVVYKLASVRLNAKLLGNTLDLSWPVAGGRLQSQTNTINAANWVTVANSTATNHVVVTVDPGNIDVYYRLVVP
ncbi:MAG: PQQ-dependent sugar dehydrogenase, partial [Limisphaerales bacterium]